MFQFLFKKQKVLEVHLNDYIQTVHDAKESFRNAMTVYLETGECSPKFEFLAGETQKAESKGDQDSMGAGEEGARSGNAEASGGGAEEEGKKES